MLKQPMIEKLAAMRLLGMAEALKAQGIGVLAVSSTQPAEVAALHVADVLVGKAGDEGLADLGDRPGFALAAVGVVVDGRAHDGLGAVIGVVLVELYVLGTRDLGLGRGGDEFRVVFGGDACQ